MKTFLNKFTLFLGIVMLLCSNSLFAQNEGTVTVESSSKIKYVLAKKKAYNKSLKKVKGFKIQLFNGSEQGAYKIRDDFSTMFPKTTIKIEFFTPEWKVRVGSYKTRLEADRALLEIREAYPSAFVFITDIKI